MPVFPERRSMEDGERSASNASPSTASPTPQTSTVASFRSRMEVFAKKAAVKGAEFSAAAREKGAEWTVKAREAAAKLQKKDSPQGSEAKGPPLFGSPLAEASAVFCSSDSPDVPAIVTRCLAFLDRHGLSEMGIHRISGSSSAVKQLRAAFASGTDVDLENEREDGRVDVHAVASLLRMYLRELTESLLTHQLEGQFAALVNASVPLTSSTPSTTPSLQDYVPRQLSNVHEGLLVQVSDLCSKLPRPNYIVLSSLFGHLSRVAAQEPLNKMGITNLQVVFAPSLGMPSALLGLFILHSTQIFQTQISSAAPSTTLDRNHGLPSGTLKRNVSLPAQYTVSPSTPKTISRLSSASNNPFDDLESEVPPTKPVRKQTLA